MSSNKRMTNVQENMKQIAEYNCTNSDVKSQDSETPDCGNGNTPLIESNINSGIYKDNLNLQHLLDCCT